MSAGAGRDWGVPDSHISDGARSRSGYRINKMCISLTKAANREAFKADEEGYMARFGLNDEERRAVRERNWLRLTELGGNVYFLMKIGACVAAPAAARAAKNSRVNSAFERRKKREFSPALYGRSLRCVALPAA